MSQENQAHATQQQQMLRSTLWSTVGNFASRLLGLVYVIPWYMWLGEHAAEGNSLFAQGYNIYTIFLLISTSGINVAIAKQVAKYNSNGQPELVFPMVRQTIIIMTIFGGILGTGMYLMAPLLAKGSGWGNELVAVVHSLSWALLIFPGMSVIRGFFQGLNNQKPYALSQVAEQIVRVVWMLLATFIIMKLGSGDYVAAIVQSTFAAFISMFASWAVLLYYLAQEGLLKELLIPNKAETSKEIKTGKVLLETLKEAIPFIITGSAIQLFQMVDQFTYVNSMSWFTDYSNTDLQVQYAYMSGNPNKIIMILVAVATSIGGVGIPLLTANYVKKDHKASAQLVLNNLTMLLLVILPAIMGGVLLSRPLYTVFYGMPDNLALGLFIVSLIQTIFLALYAVSSPMIQALSQNRNAIRYFLYGMVLKLVIQVPLIFLFHAYGPLLATALGLALPIYLMLRNVHVVTHFNRQTLMKRSLLIVILTVVMAVVVLLVEWVLGMVYPVSDRVSSVVHLVFSGVIGASVYGLLATWTRLIDHVIGATKAEQLRRKLHLG
ncbi:putative polysaccharide biosynthesis protein [Streptococcus caprae]|uniref:Oligosaccharide flippase family protein n=1 Tax=Streptococcus caprae TaxID=1640501 RepID=A0ABV8CSM5_9STRE